MRVLFRADASVDIGTGHVVRCATLAQALREQGAEVAFACRTLPGNLLDWLSQKGFTTVDLSGHAHVQDEEIATTLAAWVKTWGDGSSLGWLVVDHYGLDALWESGMRGMTQNILVIDDLANRPHDCDLLLDQNLLDPQSTRYQGLAPTHCQQLLGPRFALLRPEFIEARASMLVSLKREQPVLALTTQRLLIFFGGSDPTQECFKALEALRQLPSLDQLQVDLVAGASNPQFEALQQHCQAFPQVRLHKQSNAMSDLMAQADLALGAGGTTSWERLCLGLPSIIIAVAENQVEISQNLAEGGYHIYLGESKTVSPAALGQALGDLLTDAGKRQALCVRGMALVDGMGVHRVVERMYAAYR